MTKSVTLTALSKVPMIEPGDDLAKIIADRLQADAITLRDNDVIVIAQKIVSKAEDRYVDLSLIVPTEEALKIAEVVGKDPRHIQVVLSESSEVIKCRQNVIIVAHRLGFVMANAGIDESNIDHPDQSARVLLLPRAPDRSCAEIKRMLDAEFGVSIGVVINDSFGRPWRNGVVGVAIGSAGLPALQNLIGQPDLFGRPMRVTEVAIADELAAAASLLMGQGPEGLPVVHVRGFKSDAPEKTAQSLIRPKSLDMFR
jgi:coenzyme F420-0:L-glutamate ligase / coenzyme F420-1:gamma-L-glutamate ligase